MFVKENTGYIKDFYKISSSIGKGKFNLLQANNFIQEPLEKLESAYTKNQKLLELLKLSTKKV